MSYCLKLFSYSLAIIIILFCLRVKHMTQNVCESSSLLYKNLNTLKKCIVQYGCRLVSSQALSCVVQSLYISVCTISTNLLRVFSRSSFACFQKGVFPLQRLVCIDCSYSLYNNNTQWIRVKKRVSSKSMWSLIDYMR